MFSLQNTFDITVPLLIQYLQFSYEEMETWFWLPSCGKSKQSKKLVSEDL